MFCLIARRAPRYRLSVRQSFRPLSGQKWGDRSSWNSDLRPSRRGVVADVAADAVLSTRPQGDVRVKSDNVVIWLRISCYRTPTWEVYAAWASRLPSPPSFLIHGWSWEAGRIAVKLHRSPYFCQLLTASCCVTTNLGKQEYHRDT